jgi:hypothetical protein
MWCFLLLFILLILVAWHLALSLALYYVFNFQIFSLCLLDCLFHHFHLLSVTLLWWSTTLWRWWYLMHLLCYNPLSTRCTFFPPIFMITKPLPHQPPTSPFPCFLQLVPPAAGNTIGLPLIPLSCIQPCTPPHKCCKVCEHHVIPSSCLYPSASWFWVWYTDLWHEQALCSHETH